jgi:hypothetical protein
VSLRGSLFILLPYLYSLITLSCYHSQTTSIKPDIINASFT